MHTVCDSCIQQICRLKEGDICKRRRHMKVPQIALPGQFGLVTLIAVT